MAVEYWWPCRKGFVPASECVECCPPEEERCKNDDIGKVCRVRGPHEVHGDGMGTLWYMEK